MSLPTSLSITYAPTWRCYAWLWLCVLGGLWAFIWPWGSTLTLVLLGCWVIGCIVDITWLSFCQVQLIDTHINPQPTVEQSFQLKLIYQLIGPWNGIRYRMHAVETDIVEAESLLGIMQPVDDASTPQWASQWSFLAKKRGDWAWPGVLVRMVVPWIGFIEKWQPMGSQPLSIYPKLMLNVGQSLNPMLQLHQMGLKINRRLRADMEFESLRPYTYGDNYKHIDWKASARMQQLITRQFQVEHHHQILICLDTSRIMGTATEGITKLDWAIEATLHLANLAQHYEDNVGLMVYSNRITQWLRPRRKPVQAFLEALHNTQCQVVESNYQDVCLSILNQQKKRSLVLFLTDFMDAGSIEPFKDSFFKLNQRHCALFIGIDDPAYRKFLNPDKLTTPLAVGQTLVATDTMKRRQQVIGDLKRLGLQAFTCAPHELVERAMNGYLELRHSGLL